MINQELSQSTGGSAGAVLAVENGPGKPNQFGYWGHGGSAKATSLCPLLGGLPAVPSTLSFTSAAGASSIQPGVEGLSTCPELCRSPPGRVFCFVASVLSHLFKTVLLFGLSFLV